MTKGEKHDQSFIEFTQGEKLLVIKDIKNIRIFVHFHSLRPNY